MYAILPMTGPLAFVGKADSNALMVAENQVNAAGGIRGRQLKFVIRDDQSNPTVSVQLLNDILPNKPPVVLGPAVTSSCNAIAPLLKDGPVVYCFSPGIHPAKGSYIYTAGPSLVDLFAAIERYALGRGLHKIAAIFSTDASGQDSEQSFDSVFRGSESRGITIVDREHFNIADISVAAQMARIKASSPDAVIAWCSGTPFGTLLRGIQGAAIDVPILANSANMSYTQMHQYLGMVPRDLLFPGMPSFSANQLEKGPLKDAIRKFIDAFQANGIRPQAFENQVWDPTLIIIDAIKKYGFSATPAQIREYIDGMRGKTGTYGPIDYRTYPQRGVGPESVIIERYDPAIETWIAVSRPGGQPF